LPARQAWYEEATPFAGIAVRDPHVKPNPPTLEKYLSRPKT
jgi:catechol 2,3-dioxygenase